MLNANKTIFINLYKTQMYLGQRTQHNLSSFIYYLQKQKKTKKKTRCLSSEEWMYINSSFTKWNNIQLLKKTQIL